mmetsp:Transcript_96775/g.144915  ORF Transcript_96775/g.144915 Transcript_96775/m.144915 type:complete len:506 (+) Transcript_96775:168-1685(+)
MNHHHQHSKSKSSKKDGNDDNDVILDVVVIGAGWAGLAAAKTLQQQQQQQPQQPTFQILEARNYVGGRSLTSYEFGQKYPVDMGSAWIHGKKRNPMQALLNEYGFRYAKCDYDSSIGFDENGVRLESSEQKSWASEARSFLKYMKKRQDKDDDDVSLEEALCDYFKRKDIDPESRQARGLRTELEGRICYEYAANLSELSMFWWDMDEDLSGDDSFLAPLGSELGYSKLVGKYAETIMEHVRLETKVTKIVYGDDGLVTVDCVHASSGESLSSVRARHAIVTLPVGVLQQNSVEFSPPLPAPKRQAIQDLGMGVLNKIVLCWDMKVVTDEFLPMTREEEWIGQMVFPSTNNDEADKSSVQPKLRVREFYCPNYFSKAKGQQDDKVVLIGCCYGDDAKEIETMTDEEATEAAVQSLRCVFGDDIVPDPTQSIVTRWQSDPYSRGSYSFQKLGAKGNKTRRDLAESPVGGNLWFAGEACHMKYPSTTHGALLSGESVGKRLSKAIRN